MAVYGDSRAGRQNERHRMTIAEYAAFAGVTVAAVVLMLRACFFCFVAKTDPIKAILPDLGMAMFRRGIDKKAHVKIQGQS